MIEEKQKYHHSYHHDSPSPPNSYKARGGEREVGRKNIRNSVTLPFMLIHLSTGNLY